MWFITLVVLALTAFLIIKAVKAQSIRKSEEDSQLGQTSGLQGTLSRESRSQDSVSQTSSPDNSDATPSSTTETPSNELSGQTAQTSNSAVDSPLESQEIREMIKTLNLTEADSSRLGIDAKQFAALRSEDGENMSSLPAPQVQSDVADRLRRMLA